LAGITFPKRRSWEFRHDLAHWTLALSSFPKSYLDYALGISYCSDAECWARLRLSRVGAEYGDPQLAIIADPRDYLPDLTAEPRYLPAPVKGIAAIPVYPAKPRICSILIEKGKENWYKYITQQSYQKIDQALIAFNSFNRNDQ